MTSPSIAKDRSTDWALFGWLLLASLLGVSLGVPFLVAGLPDRDPMGFWLSAGFTEEILFRLGLMTLFAWLLRTFVSRSGSAEPSVSIANLLAALLFAAAHLPGNVTPETATWIFVTGILGFNAVAGMVMGWLYFRHGLLSAVLAHFPGDVVGYAIPSML